MINKKQKIIDIWDSMPEGSYLLIRLDDKWETVIVNHRNEVITDCGEFKIKLQEEDFNEIQEIFVTNSISLIEL